MSDDKLESIVKEYAELAKDKKIDTAALMINALQQQNQNRLSASTKRWSYLAALGLPPIGYLLALWLFTRDESDAKTTAYVCIILTTISIVLSVIFFQAVLKTSGTSVEQIQQIKPQDIYQLTE